jgi:hypothetical protein
MKEEKFMVKKLLCVIFLMFFVFGCSTAGSNVRRDIDREVVPPTKTGLDLILLGVKPNPLSILTGVLLGAGLGVKALKEGRDRDGAQAAADEQIEEGQEKSNTY